MVALQIALLVAQLGLALAVLWVSVGLLCATRGQQKAKAGLVESLQRLAGVIAGEGRRDGK